MRGMLDSLFVAGVVVGVAAVTALAQESCGYSVSVNQYPPVYSPGSYTTGSPGAALTTDADQTGGCVLGSITGTRSRGRST